MKLLFVKNKNIDYKKWDETIAKSYNGNIYAYSWYLDIVCDWNAIVSSDYKYLMPLPTQKKFFIKYTFTPVLIQQLGVFSTNQINDKILNKFLNLAQKKYKYFDIKFNKYNEVTKLNIEKKENITYELDLIQNYTDIYKKYSTNTKRNLKKAEQNNLTISTNITIKQIIYLLEQNLKKQIKDLNEKTLNKIKFLISQSSHKNMGKTIGIYNNRNKLISAAFFTISHNKAIMLILATSNESKKTGANFKLIDYFIKQNSGKHLTLDFEGSNIESLARFYASFGAKKFKYFNLKYNNLPSLIKIIKK